MHLQVVLLGGLVVALVALVRFLTCVSISMASQLVLASKSFATNVASVALKDKKMWGFMAQSLFINPHLDVFGFDVLVASRPEGKLLIAIVTREVLFLFTDVSVVEVLSEPIN